MSSRLQAFQQQQQTVAATQACRSAGRALPLSRRRVLRCRAEVEGERSAAATQTGVKSRMGTGSGLAWMCRSADGRLSVRECVPGLPARWLFGGFMPSAAAAACRARGACRDQQLDCFNAGPGQAGGLIRARPQTPCRTCSRPVPFAVALVSQGHVQLLEVFRRATAWLFLATQALLCQSPPGRQQPLFAPGPPPPSASLRPHWVSVTNSCAVCLLTA